MTFGGGNEEEGEAPKPSPEEAENAVRKLLQGIRDGSITIFDKREARALQRMAQLWLGFEAVGKFADVARKVLIWFGWLIGLYLAWKSHALTGYLSGGGE